MPEVKTRTMEKLIIKTAAEDSELQKLDSSGDA